MASKNNAIERRQSPENREIFEGVYPRVEPFIDPESGWVGQPLEHQAYNVLREQYPSMSEDELSRHLQAAKRVFKERSSS